MISAPITVPEWVEHSACTPDEADLFFTPGMESSARALCRVCPVREECLRDARQRGEKHGIWGGVDMSQTGTGAGCRNGHGPEHRIRREGSTRDTCLACKRDADRRRAAAKKARRARLKAEKEAAR